MKAIKGKNFPIVGGNIADECPVCSSVIVSIGFNRGICPSCAREEIISLRKEVARLTKRALDSATPCPDCGSKKLGIHSIKCSRYRPPSK